VPATDWSSLLVADSGERWAHPFQLGRCGRGSTEA
jgi:hypothetical protein